jgi:hypothetical protein
MPSHWSFGHLKLTLWAKEGPGVKLAVWLLTTKSRESTSSQPPIENATRRWKDLDEDYNFGLDLVMIRLRSRELWAPKVPRFQPGQFRDNFGTISGLQLGSPGKMCHLDVIPMEWRREYYVGEGGGFPRIRTVVNLVCQSAHGLSQHPRVFRMWTNPFVVGFGCRFKLDLLVPLPSLILGLLAHPSTPL